MNDSSHQKPQSGLYCAGCNERFSADAVGNCPRCGADVDADWNLRLNESLLLRDSRVHSHNAAQRPEAGEEQLGRLIGSRLHIYRLDSLLGRGGMGWVFLSHHSDLDRKCALKILSPRLSAADTDYVHRFKHEGRATASLNHPNIVTTHAIGEADGYHFLEMEFVAGRTLQQLLEDEGRLTALRSTVLTARIAEGLSAAHRASILHRDLKLDNVLLTHRGIPKIADFGLAKRIITGSGETPEKLVGTPNYMAPELLNGEAATPASDVYALGVCYYVMLTGRFPYVGGSLSALRTALATEVYPSPRVLFDDVPLEMAECLSLLMAKSPENRPRDGIEAAQLLHAVCGQVRDIESLLKEAFAHTDGIRWTRTGSSYRLELSLPEGRRQTLFIEPSDHAAADRLLLMYSVCCDARPEYYEEALRLNSEVLHGGIAIREIDGVAKFVMVDTYPRATVDAEEIRRSALEVAYRADSIEKLLTGRDEN